MALIGLAVALVIRRLMHKLPDNQQSPGGQTLVLSHPEPADSR
jgi:hypothetical protein